VQGTWCRLAAFGLVVGFCSGARAGGSGTKPDITEVRVEITPGKPMQLFRPGEPAEEIIAQRQGDLYALHIRCNVPRERVTRYTEVTKPLTAQQWASLLAVITEHHLELWKPAETPGVVLDSGSQGYSIQGSRQVQQRWSKPLDNAEAPGALFRFLASLAEPEARERGLLFYLGVP
jgi:hypothetical protein